MRSCALFLLMGATAICQTLSYRQPAQNWQSQALPIGNGRLGAMIFGDARQEHLQLNENSLWTGNEKDTGRYQSLGDLFLDLEHGAPEHDSYHRQLDIANAIHSIEYTAGSIAYRREYFASFPAQVLVFHFTASQAGAYTGTVKFTDAHNAAVGSTGSALMATGKLDNGLAYETQISVLHQGGEVRFENGVARVEKADALTIIVGAGTNYLPERSKSWRGDLPHDRIARQIRTAAGKPFNDLRAAHLADYQALFSRVSLNLGTSAENVRAGTTEERLAEYAAGGRDPELDALFFQFGRYLLISSSRPGGLPGQPAGTLEQLQQPAVAQRLPLQYQCPDELLAGRGDQSRRVPPAVLRLRQQPARRAHRGHSRTITCGSGQTVRGWTVQTENNIFGAGSFKWNPPGSAWYAQHFWEHYAFAPDMTFLRTVAYPVLKEVTPVLGGPPGAAPRRTRW